MTDLVPTTDIDPAAAAIEIRRALQASGLNLADPDIRTLLVDALTDRGPDRRISAAEKRRYALDLRVAGATYREIARIVGFSGPGPAHRTVMKALEAIPQESAEELRNLNLARIDAMLAGGLWTRARKGEESAIDRVIALMREQRRYVPGLEVPAGTEVSLSGGSIVVELSIPEPVPVEPVPQHLLGDRPVIDVPSVQEPAR